MINSSLPIYLTFKFRFLELLSVYTSPDDIDIQSKIFARISDYCGRKVTNHTLDVHPDPYVWNFFHAFYFSFTTCTTVGNLLSFVSNNIYFHKIYNLFFIYVGYGNISPSSSLGRIILCFYALFGIPLSCFFIASVAHFFAATVRKVFFCFL